MGLPPPQPPEPVVGTLGGGEQWAAASAAPFGRKARAARARDRQAAAEAKAIPCPPTEAIKLLAARLWRGRFDALRGGVLDAAAEARGGGSHYLEPVGLSLDRPSSSHFLDCLLMRSTHEPKKPQESGCPPAESGAAFKHFPGIYVHGSSAHKHGARRA